MVDGLPILVAVVLPGDRAGRSVGSGSSAVGVCSGRWSPIAIVQLVGLGGFVGTIVADGRSEQWA